jgi:hypothetical protein
MAMAAKLNRPNWMVAHPFVWLRGDRRLSHDREAWQEQDEDGNVDIEQLLSDRRDDVGEVADESTTYSDDGPFRPESFGVDFFHLLKRWEGSAFLQAIF